MATTVDELITKYTLDPSGYVTGGAVVTRTTKTIADDTDRAVGGMKSQFASMGNQIESGLRAGFGVAQAFVGVLTGIGAAYVAFGASAMQAAANQESLVLGLRAVIGNADRAATALTKLKEASKSPGLGYSEAVGGFTKLVNAGMSETMSLEAVKQFANANALAGGGKEQFGRILLALSQIANTEYLQGDELRQFSEANIPASRLVRERFGTADTEKLKSQGVTSGEVIKGLIEDLSKFERVAGGTRNSFDNLSDAFDFFRVQIGTVLNSEFVPFFDKMADAMSDLVASGGMKTFTESLISFLDLPKDATEVKNVFYDILEITLTVGFGLRNAVMNLQDLYNTFKPPWLRALESGEDSPMNEAKAVIDTMRKQDELAQKSRQLPSGAWVRKGGPNDIETPLDDGSGKKATEKASTADRIAEYTRETAQNTRAMREAMRDAIIGGGFFGSKGVTHREAARFVNSVVDSRV